MNKITGGIAAAFLVLGLQGYGVAESGPAEGGPSKDAIEAVANCVQIKVKEAGKDVSDEDKQACCDSMDDKYKDKCHERVLMPYPGAGPHGPPPEGHAGPHGPPR